MRGYFSSSESASLQLKSLKKYYYVKFCDAKTFLVMQRISKHFAFKYKAKSFMKCFASYFNRLPPSDAVRKQGKLF